MKQIPNPEIIQIDAQFQQNLQRLSNPASLGAGEEELLKQTNLGLVRRKSTLPQMVAVDTSAQDAINAAVESRRQAGRDSLGSVNEQLGKLNNSIADNKRKSDQAKGEEKRLRQMFRHGQASAGQVERAEKKVKELAEQGSDLTQQQSGLRTDVQKYAAEVSATEPLSE
ncbi:hypothetical protein [Vibrio chagasii]|uniref:hypothetical protein n=1 Tax=Vibrio chagasii TaxID=170679 RepID=UPI003DA154A5